MCVCVNVGGCMGAAVPIWRSQTPWVSILTFHHERGSPAHYCIHQASWPMIFWRFSCLYFPPCYRDGGLTSEPGLAGFMWVRGIQTQPGKPFIPWAIPPVRKALIRQLGQGQHLPGSLGSPFLCWFPMEDRYSHVASGHSFPLCMNLQEGPSPSRSSFNRPHPQPELL